MTWIQNGVGKSIHQLSQIGTDEKHFGPEADTEQELNKSSFFEITISHLKASFLSVCKMKQLDM